MDLTDKDKTALNKILEFESKLENPRPQYYLGWEWFDVCVPQGTINRLITLELIKRTYQSRSSKNHQLTEKGIAIATQLADTVSSGHRDQNQVQAHVSRIDFSTMFSDIVGYDNLKELLRECLLVDKPIHVLMVGPPALAKTLFLWDIERAWGDQAMWLVGSATSRAGLWDGVAEQRPKIILIDELDKMTASDTAALLSLMEKGRLVRMKVHRKLDIELDVWVVACANRIYKMSPELLSRFKVYTIHEYGAVEFREVVTSALVTHEGITENEAAEIALRLVGKTHDVRDAVRVARLSKRVGIARAVELLMV